LEIKFFFEEPQLLKNPELGKSSVFPAHVSYRKISSVKKKFEFLGIEVLQNASKKKAFNLTIVFLNSDPTQNVFAAKYE